MSQRISSVYHNLMGVLLIEKQKWFQLTRIQFSLLCRPHSINVSIIGNKWVKFDKLYQDNKVTFALVIIWVFLNWILKNLENLSNLLSTIFSHFLFPIYYKYYSTESNLQKTIFGYFCFSNYWKWYPTNKCSIFYYSIIWLKQLFPEWQDCTPKFIKQTPVLTCVRWMPFLQ